jgi:hypothetical protein
VNFPTPKIKWVRSQVYSNVTLFVTIRFREFVTLVLPIFFKCLPLKLFLYLFCGICSYKWGYFLLYFYIGYCYIDFFFYTFELAFDIGRGFLTFVDGSERLGLEHFLVAFSLLRRHSSFSSTEESVASFGVFRKLTMMSESIFWKRLLSDGQHPPLWGAQVCWAGVGSVDTGEMWSGSEKHGQVREG